ncbi:S9 family peptidase [Permianibacter sp. IMCC34836]|uniref:S9 family peptidase n=1 Tax=Permianibacter fluminis TaxID=2738515 RepID=UPI0015535BDB|nr:prolyl oligopeptidase family serine peptidase [Permianibacter fluminis]NQD38760.1 S9 family peptidase [Permianibacter fluminis]
MRWSASTGNEELLPTWFNVRSKVHEYGGGEFAVRDGALLFVAEPDQQLWLRTASGDLRALTEVSQPPRSIRYADMCWHPGGEWCYAVRERHHDQDVINELVAVSLTGAIQVLASGADFYATPTVSPDGMQLAWLQWSHPLMPWDGTQLQRANLRQPDSLLDSAEVAGGATESVLQPLFAGNNQLFALSDRSGYWQPGVVLANGWQPLQIQSAEAQPETSADAFAHNEFAVAPWSLGTRTWCVTDGGDIWLIGSVNGFQQLWRLSPEPDGTYRAAPQHFSQTAPTSESVCCLAPHLAVAGDAVFVLASATDQPERLMALQPGRDSQQCLTGTVAWPADVMITPAKSVMTEVAGRKLPFFFYRPAERTRCPLLLFCHSGPTGAASPALQATIQFWTSRGYAVADVNYRGSDGFGRDWRQSLLGHWGEYDVADCLAVVDSLIRDGAVDPDRIYLRGNSAGGLTALHMLAASGRIRAAALRYPVVDLVRLAAISHKFEARYLHRLVGAGGSDEQRLHQMSPTSIFPLIKTPVLVQQGEQDPVVPLAQAQQLVASLQGAGVDHELVVHTGEGHGFRRADTLMAALAAELAFFSRHA